MTRACEPPERSEGMGRGATSERSGGSAHPFVSLRVAHPAPRSRAATFPPSHPSNGGPPTGAPLMTRFLLGPLLLLIPAVLPAQQAERYTLDEGPAAIYNLVGAVRVEPGTGAVTVQVTRVGGERAKLQIGHGEIDGRATLRVVYPADRIRSGDSRSRGSTQLRVRDDGTFGDQDWDAHGRKEHHRWEEAGRRVTIADGSDGLDARADLVVSVPRGADVSVYLAVGSVTV